MLMDELMIAFVIVYDNLGEWEKALMISHFENVCH